MQTKSESEGASMMKIALVGRGRISNRHVQLLMQIESAFAGKEVHLHYVTQSVPLGRG